VWLASAALPVVGTHRNIEFEIEFYTSIAYVGIAFLGDDSDPSGLHCYNYLCGGGWRSRVDQGVLFSPSATAGQLLPNTPAVVRIQYQADKVGGMGPRWLQSGYGLHATSVAAYVDSQTWAGVAPATWNPLTCDRWGLVTQAGGGQGIKSFELLNIRIWSW
jgi:hypothetical protein